MARVSEASKAKNRAYLRDRYKSDPQAEKARSAAWKKAHPQQANEHSLASRRRHPAKWLLRCAKSRAKQLGIQFALTENDIVIPTHCPVLGIELTFFEGGRRNSSPSIDRRDNSKGYTPDNIVVVCWRANKLKSDATSEELCMLADYYGGRA